MVRQLSQTENAKDATIPKKPPKGPQEPKSKAPQYGGGPDFGSIPGTKKALNRELLGGISLSWDL